MCIVIGIMLPPKKHSLVIYIIETIDLIIRKILISTKDF